MNKNILIFTVYFTTGVNILRTVIQLPMIQLSRNRESFPFFSIEIQLWNKHHYEFLSVERNKRNFLGSQGEDILCLLIHFLICFVCLFFQNNIF